MHQQVHSGLIGRDAFLARFLRDAASGRVMLVCRPTSFRMSGAQEWLSTLLGSESVVFNDFSTNPKEEEVYRGVAAFRARDVSAIIAVGGGSTLDMAKLINCFGSRGIDLDESLRSLGDRDRKLRPMLAIPTTSGSGSEATRFAVVYRGGKKLSVTDERARPSHVMLIPELTWSLSPYQTACSGMDALSQAVEACWALSATDESRCQGRQAISSLLRHLDGAVNNPTPHDRVAMLDAAYAAGCAIDQSRTTGVHAFSYGLTTEFGLSHGHAVGILLPFFVAYHERAGIHIPGIDEKVIEGLLEHTALCRKIPASYGAVLNVLTKQVNPERLSNNPVPVDQMFIQELARSLSSTE